MNTLQRKSVLFLAMAFIASFAPSTQTANAVPFQSLPATGLNRGVNFGNMLEAPSEGAWGLTMQTIFFDKVVEGGFDHIRLPVSWTHHASNTSPHTINPVFFQRVDWALDQAESRGLKLILNMHHYDEFNADPVAQWARALNIWKQIAYRYRNRGAFLYFEILNEPHGVFNQQPELWNKFMEEALTVIRKWNPNRPVLVGPVRWNSIDGLLYTNFKPPKDNNVIITIHNYEPFDFTHQGASWINPIPPIGVTWSGARKRISAPWQNWSWGTSVSNTNNGIQVTYNQGWAGLYAHSDRGVELATRLTITVDKPLNLRIVTRSDQFERIYNLTTGTNGGTYNIALDPSIGPVKDIYVQNNTAQSVPPYLMSKFEIEGVAGVQSIVRSESEEVRALMTAAYDWARARNRPLYLGEFGAYEMGDMASRAEWTSFVRREAERLTMGWGYWEFGAGFGVYNPNTGTFRQPLLNALISP